MTSLVPLGKDRAFKNPLFLLFFQEKWGRPDHSGSAQRVDLTQRVDELPGDLNYLQVEASYSGKRHGLDKCSYKLNMFFESLSKSRKVLRECLNFQVKLKINYFCKQEV